MIERTHLNIAQTVGVLDVKPTELKEQIKSHLISERAGKWLLIFDNADGMNMRLLAGDATLALQNFLPQSEQGHILFNTRNTEIAVELLLSNIIPIPE
ncbi:uncharacterized protein ATNIH1004_003560 [Aspergillus tanneri]|uniref:Uncharacterized protein n=1 Tax=Aspergillus tanneri TaxID=1220188 RepID=A0A5M9MUT7_9EURO|nr:uncharacterized protein ATNIH1004_003560 [Aspergillus tanneri]KAA8650871.1 hypothetical protein ATNIH1004_003560 [Aspergillus tanneri]